MRIVSAAVSMALLAAPAVAAPAPGQARFIRALDRMMVALGHESARAGATIRRAYQEHLDLLMLEGYSDLEGALDNGGLVPLPQEARYNLAPRLDGAHPIGEKDLANQQTYVSARPATVGMLVEVASRVGSGPLEITSLVRHHHYQEALGSTNANARTSVPMHTLGLAADIGLVHTPLETVYEIRDVLRRMQREGKILFIGERRQLVFHVVPHPSRIGYFNDVYARTVGAPATSRSAQVTALAPTVPERRDVRHASLDAARAWEPTVTAEVVAVLPADASLDPWWLDSPRETAAPSARPPARPVVAIEPVAASAGIPAPQIVFVLACLLSMWRATARPRFCALFGTSREWRA